MNKTKFRFWNGKKLFVYDLFSIPQGISYINKPMQFTGVFDRNNKEIYERDIISDISHGTELRRFTVEDIRTFTREFDRSEHSSEWEVIGNIYENYNLLKI